MLKMKKFHRLLAALLAVLMLSVCIPAMAFANEDDRILNITFQYNDENEVNHTQSYQLGGDKSTMLVPDAAVVGKPDLPDSVWTTDGYDAMAVLTAGQEISIGDFSGYDADYITYNLKIQETEEPAEKPLTTMRVHYVDAALNDLAETYSLTGGDVWMPTAADIDVPENARLVGWTLKDYGENEYAPGTSLTFGELATVVGDNYYKPDGTVDLYFYAVFEAVEPAEKPLTTMRVHFVDAALNDLAETYSLTGGDVWMPTAADIDVPENARLVGWTLKDYGENEYAPGTSLTFGELATVVGDNYYKPDGTVDLYFYAVFETVEPVPATKTVGLNYWDIVTNEQVAEGSVEVSVDANNANTSTFTDIPEGYELVWTGDLQINDGWVWVELRPAKTVRIFWAIDNGEAADFADGSADNYTQELTWKHINDDIAMPQLVIADGYELAGWSVNGRNGGEYWDADAAAAKIADRYVEDEKGGILSITANIVAAPATTTTTTTPKDEHPDIAEGIANGTWGAAPTAAPAAAADANTIPQTGDNLPVAFLIVVAAAAAGAVGGLSVLRKRSRQ